MEEKLEESESLQLVLEAASRRENAILNLFRHKETLKNFCEKIKKDLDFEFVSIQLIRPEEKTIEAAFGVDWAGQAKHYLEKSSILRDIQADIAQTCKTEIIAGWDIDERFKDKNHEISRFDEWRYKKFNHKDYIRVFTPIFLIEDDKGSLNLSWLDNFIPNVTKHELHQDWFNYKPKERSEKLNGQHTILELCFPDLDSERNWSFVEVIGTVEAGYKNPEQLKLMTGKESIEINQAIDLIKLVAQQARKIYSTLLPSVLKEIADSSRSLVKADSTSLHFLINSNQMPLTHKISACKIVPIFSEETQEEQDRIPFAYRVFSGKLGRHFLIQCAPRRNGLGEKAIQERKYKFVPNPSKDEKSQTLKKFNPKAFELGIRAIAAFPLLLEHKQGVLYISFQDEHQFTESELHLIDIFAKGAVHAIRHAITYQETQDCSNQITILHQVAQSLVQTPDGKALLEEIAWSTLNMLGADIVTIYEYKEQNRKFGKPATAGKLKEPGRILLRQTKNYVPYKIISRYSNPYYVSDVSCDDIFQKSVFTDREEIKSVAAIPLKIGQKSQEETIGIMLINYRRTHNFSSDEQKLIETLASSAAIAIENQRWLSVLREIDREIISTLDKNQLLKLIVRKAQEITRADAVDIRLLEPINQELVMIAWLPEDTRDKSIRTKLGEGITGWVAKTKEAYITNNTQEDSHYKSFYRKSDSELCVPLLDKKGLLGVLNVESKRTRAFTQRHEQQLQALADQAVIAIKNAENQQHLSTIKTTSTLEKWAVNFVHRAINNDVAAIRVWAKDILEEGEQKNKEKINKILNTAERIVEEANHVCIWIEPGKKVPVSLAQIVQEIIDKTNLPPQVDLDYDLPPDLPQILGNQQQLIDVFDNLIQNALAAMPEGGTLSIGVEEIGSWVKIWVHDTGVGITKKNLKKIFKPGFRRQPSKTGMGFGLWWAKAYIEEYLEGYLTVESEFKKWSKFSVTLPTYGK